MDNVIIHVVKSLKLHYMYWLMHKTFVLVIIVFNVFNQFDILRVFLRGASLDHENSPTMMLLSLKYKKSESFEKSDEQLE